MWSKETKFFVGLVIVLFFIFGLWLATTLPKNKVDVTDFEQNRPMIGSDKAAVEVKVYFDYYCSHCKEAEAVVEKIYNDYGDQVKILFRYLPISEASFLPDAAAECAQRQGKFWNFHKLLFASQGSNFSPDRLRGFAGQAQLDVNQFSQCLSNQETVPVVQSDLKKGLAAGIEGTPTIFVNGKKIDWARLEAEVIAVIGNR